MKESVWRLIYISIHVLATQLCLTLCKPMEYSLPRSSVHGILQARILEWVAISSSREFSRPRDRTQAPASPVLAGGFFTTAPPEKSQHGCTSYKYINIQIMEGVLIFLWMMMLTVKVLRKLIEKKNKYKLVVNKSWYEWCRFLFRMRQLFLGCELTITLVSTLWQMGSKICHTLNFQNNATAVW